MFVAAGTGAVIGSGVGAGIYLSGILAKPTLTSLGIAGAEYVATHPGEVNHAINSAGRLVANNSDKVERIAFGVREHLDKFTARVEATNYKQWGPGDFQSQFLEKIASPSTRIHFNLDGITNVMKAVQQGSRGYQNAGSVTNWELYQIYSQPEVLQRTTFYLNGIVVASPF